MKKGLSTGFFRISALSRFPKLLLARPWIETSVYGRVGIGNESREAAGAV
jgi:hypothetical protein